MRVLHSVSRYIIASFFELLWDGQKNEKKWQFSL